MRDEPAAPPTSPDLESPPRGDPDQNDLLHAYIARTAGCCPLCRYDLRGIPNARCPECGQELMLEIRLAQPMIGRWIALFVIVAMSFGWSSTFGVIAITQAGRSWWREVSGMLLIVAMLGSTPLLIATLLLRRRFLRLPKPVQRGIVGVTFVVTFTVLTLFIWWFDG